MCRGRGEKRKGSGDKEGKIGWRWEKKGMRRGTTHPADSLGMAQDWREMHLP